MTYKDIISHEIACNILEKDPLQSTTKDQQITDICNAINKLNGNFKADFNKPEQKKWRPFFYVSEEGFAFSSSDYDLWDSSTGVGSRLCHYVGSEAQADHLGTQFLKLHKANYFGE